MIKFESINKKLPRIYNLIKENIYSCATEPIVISDIKYHHKLQSQYVVSVLEHGLLSRRLKAELVDKRNLTDQEILTYSAAWHVNGVDYISLAIEEDQDIQKIDNCDQWHVHSNFFTDIIVSDEVQTKKNSTNYSNEYLVEDKIPVDFFKSIDVRILKILDDSRISKRKKIKLLLEYYESIRNIALYVVENNLSIPIRETSKVNSKEEYDEAITLDPYKIIKLSRIK